MLGGINELTYVKHLEQYMTHKKCLLRTKAAVSFHVLSSPLFTVRLPWATSRPLLKPKWVYTGLEGPGQDLELE